MFLIFGVAIIALGGSDQSIVGLLMLIQAADLFYQAYRKKPYQIPDQETKNRRKRKWLILFTTALLVVGIVIGTERFLPLAVTHQQIGIYRIDPFLCTVLVIWYGLARVYYLKTDWEELW